MTAERRRSGAPITSLVLGKVPPPPGDDTLKFSGRLTAPLTPPIDLLHHGVRLIIAGQTGVPVLDLTLSTGAYAGARTRGWIEKTGSALYLDTTGAPQGGITRLTVTTPAGTSSL